MADAVAAYKEAFQSYKSRVIDYALYSLLTNVLETILALALVAAMIVAGVLSLGAISKLFVAGTGLTLGLVGISTTVIVLGIGLLIFSWIALGITGAYLETLNIFLSGKKQSLNGFLSAVPKRASAIFIATIISGIFTLLPLVLFSVLAMLLDFFLSIVIYLLGFLLAAIVMLFFLFALPAIVVDNRSPIEALKKSISTTARNFLTVIIYLLINALLMLPAIVPGLGAIYLALFYMPLSAGALLLIYKKAK